MQKPQFINDQIYHIYNRGVEKRKIFLNDKDRYRFIHDLFEFNDERPALNTSYYFDSNSAGNNSKKPRKLLVDILVFTLMPNHFHLILKQRKENGISKFMQKLGTGYTMYFNQKRERVGSLFQGRYKAKLINKNAHFIHLPYYIHLNPLKLLNYGGSTSIDFGEAMRFLENYRWSSFADYIGKTTFPSVTQRKFLLEFLGGEAEYKKETKKWLSEETKNLQEIKKIILE